MPADAETMTLALVYPATYSPFEARNALLLTGLRVTELMEAFSAVVRFTVQESLPMELPPYFVTQVKVHTPLLADGICPSRDAFIEAVFHVWEVAVVSLTAVPVTLPNLYVTVQVAVLGYLPENVIGTPAPIAAVEALIEAAV